MIQYETKDFLLSEKYVGIVQGMDNFFRRNSIEGTESSLNDEGLVPVNLTDITPNNYTNWEEIILDFNNLKKEFRTLKSELRSFYMLKQIDSLLNLIKWSKEEDLDFRVQVRGFLFVNENPFTKQECERLHYRLQEKFKSIGLTADIHSNYSKWSHDRLIPKKEVESTLEQLFDETKEKVVENMFPEVESVDVKVEIAHDIPFSAYCDYVNKKMIINGDYDYTYESLKHLAAHEVFPGHMTHLHIREAEYKKGNVPADSALVITNTASSPIFEGIGDNGLNFINWNTTVNDEISDLLQQIKSIAGMNSSYLLNELGRTPNEVEKFLKDFAFGQEEWIDSRMRFISHPLRGPFIYSYYRGYEGVHEIYKDLPKDRHANFFRFIYENMLSIEELKTYR